jgi:hypothetical protein
MPEENGTRKMPNSDWMDNHESRITKLENWKDMRTEIDAKLANVASNLVDSTKEHEKRLERIDDRVNKLVISGLTTIVLLLVSIVLKLVLK